MKVVVTGGAGFIGSHVVDKYVELGCDVIVLDNLSTGRIANVNPKARFHNMDISDENLEEWIKFERPELINHHAAQVNVRMSVDYPLYDLNINLLNTVRLFEAAGRQQVKKIIFISSGGAIYGNAPNRRPISENYTGYPISPYGINKLAAEHYLAYFAEKYSFDWSILRYSNVYGSRQQPYSEAGVISIFQEKLANGIRPIIYGNGEQVRDYIHVSDVVEANMLVSQMNPSISGTYNVGTGTGTSLNKLLHLLFNYYAKTEPIYQEPKRGDLPWNILSNKKMQSMGWSPRVSLNEGIRQLVSMYGK